MKLDNAYRPRKGQEDRIPHSFTFRKRESFLAVFYMCVKPGARTFAFPKACLAAYLFQSAFHDDTNRDHMTFLPLSNITCVMKSHASQHC